MCWNSSFNADHFPTLIIMKNLCTISLLLLFNWVSMEKHLYMYMTVFPLEWEVLFKYFKPLSELLYCLLFLLTILNPVWSKIYYIWTQALKNICIRKCIHKYTYKHMQRNCFLVAEQKFKTTSSEYIPVREEVWSRSCQKRETLSNILLG